MFWFINWSGYLLKCLFKFSISNLINLSKSGFTKKYKLKTVNTLFSSKSSKISDKLSINLSIFWIFLSRSNGTFPSFKNKLS